MKNLKALFVLVLLFIGVLTSCTKQDLNEEEQQFKENFQGVDRDVQRPGTQAQSQETVGD